MTREFIFSLMNPAIALVFSATFLALWWARPAGRYALLLGIAFLVSGVAFATNDLLQPLEGNFLRLAVNGMFLAAVALVCMAVNLRITCPFPTATFVTIIALGAVGFVWFLFIDPSTLARVYIMNATVGAMAFFTLLRQWRAKPHSSVDKIFMLTTMLILVLALMRLVAIMLEILDVNSDGFIQTSVYWASVQAMTPLLAMAISMTFLATITIELFDEVRHEAKHDYLSGLLNRRGFDLTAGNVLDSVPARNLTSAAMIADIDNFKIINDRFGHAVGDRVIAAVGCILNQQTAVSVAGRTGGEEFSLLFTSKSLAELMTIADEIRDRVRDINVDGLPENHIVTLSIGIHQRRHNEALTQMMTQADEALYRSKLAGKDRATLTTSDAPPAAQPLVAVGF